MTGEKLIPASQQDTWAALNDPDVLKACVPGCESITRVNDNEYQVQMTARVGPVSAKFRGRLSLFDIKPPVSYSLAFEGQGGPAGFAKGAAQVKLSPEGNQTRLAYDVKANVGGKLAQIGSRLVDAAAKKVADEFFQNFTKRMTASEDETVVMEAAAPHGGAAAADPVMPSVSNTTLIFFAAGALVVCIVALVALFG
ncbi:MAG TPA: carbon monoxide dehydrogenase subunit G [Burkholderiales bacterium]|nr:carbon monoxide dehydrogenase subunit G [Burkholderiales bacterium]